MCVSSEEKRYRGEGGEDGGARDSESLYVKIWGSVSEMFRGDYFYGRPVSTPKSHWHG